MGNNKSIRHISENINTQNICYESNKNLELNKINSIYNNDSNSFKENSCIIKRNLSSREFKYINNYFDISIKKSKSFTNNSNLITKQNNIIEINKIKANNLFAIDSIYKDNRATMLNNKHLISKTKEEEAFKKLASGINTQNNNNNYIKLNVLNTNKLNVKMRNENKSLLNLRKNNAKNYSLNCINNDSSKTKENFSNSYNENFSKIYNNKTKNLDYKRLFNSRIDNKDLRYKNNNNTIEFFKKNIINKSKKNNKNNLNFNNTYNNFNEDNKDDNICIVPFLNNIVKTKDNSTINKFKSSKNEVKCFYERDNNVELSNSINNNSDDEDDKATTNYYHNKKQSKVDLLRKEYILMLIKNKIWIPGKKQILFNSIVILDWDDTLLCTTFLTPKGVFDEDINLSEEELNLISKLEFSVLRFLSMCLETKYSNTVSMANYDCDIYIITNSEKGWVDYSALRYMPSVGKLIRKNKHKITIISARDQFNSIYPNESRQWKINAYKSIRNAYTDVSTNIINIGDSVLDIEAGLYLSKEFKECYLKSIKLKETPSISELIKQLNLIINQFDFIFKTVKNLTIKVGKK